MGLIRTRSGFALFVVGARNIGFGQGYELHDWGFALPRGDGAIGSELRTGHIHTGQALGAFGKIDLTFGSFRPLKRQTLFCGSGQPRVTSGHLRRGTLKGSLNFTSNEGTLPDLHVTNMRAVIERSVRFKRFPCKESGPHYKPHCYPQTEITVADKAQKAEAELYGPNEIYVNTFMGTKTFSESHELSISGLARITHVGPSGLSVDASALAPFLSGSLGFETGAVRHHRGALCQITRTNEVWTSGTLTANLDSGALDLTGSGLQGEVTAHKRP